MVSFFVGLEVILYPYLLFEIDLGANGRFGSDEYPSWADVGYGLGLGILLQGAMLL